MERFLKRRRHKLERTRNVASVFGIAVVAVALTLCGIIAIGVLRGAFDHQQRYPQQSIMSPYNLNRTEVYEKMAADYRLKGATFLAGGDTTQSLKLSDIFRFEGDKVLPFHKPAEPPVRATVLYLPQRFSEIISHSVKETFGSRFSAIWYQNPEIYHFSLFHASHHLEAVIASPDEIDAELKAVKEVADSSCPLRIQLERIILTSTGALVGCWQVLEGTDPFILRSQLKSKLPNAPQKQLYDPYILHSSFARILPPTINDTMKESNKMMTASLLEELVSDLNKQLHKFEASIEELWFVEELDILALALNGRTHVHKFSLGCRN